VFDLYLLTWTSGVMDALSYVRAKVFTANMTGNAVIVGLAVAGPERSRVFDCAVAIIAFALGVLLGGIWLLRLKQPDERNYLRIGTFLELPFAIAFSVLWMLFPAGGQPWVLPVLTAIAACTLGIQSVAVRRLKILGAVTTFITGTMTTAIVSALERYDVETSVGREAKSSPLLLGGMFVLYIVAAMTGAALAVAKSPFAALDALITLLIVFLRSWRG
jgi:uncharacterized membrane protein YoaK (UPF0700 family)